MSLARKSSVLKPPLGGLKGVSCIDAPTVDCTHASWPDLASLPKQAHRFMMSGKAFSTNVKDGEAAMEAAGGWTARGTAAALPCLFKSTQQGGVKNQVAKKAETLFQNLGGLIQQRGINHCGFMTLTFAENLLDRREAQRRFNNLATQFRREVPGFEYVVCVERQARGAIHYHCIVALPWDIRSGFDFKALGEASQAAKQGNGVLRREIERRSNWFNAGLDLRNWWQSVRAAAAVYGFGRCETFPIASNAEGVARYVGAYVGKEFAMRRPEDKGLRTVRYGLKRRVCSDGSRWQWCGGSGRAWRTGCGLVSQFFGQEFGIEGKGQAWKWRKRIGIVAKHELTVRDVMEIRGLAVMAVDERRRLFWQLYRYLCLFERLMSGEVAVSDRCKSEFSRLFDAGNSVEGKEVSYYIKSRKKTVARFAYSL